MLASPIHAQSPPSCTVFAKIRTMSKSTDRINLTNQFLIAMPGMGDDVCRNGGLPVRAQRAGRARPGDQQADRHRAEEPVREGRPHARTRGPRQEPVYFGGPVQTERGFVLHEPLAATTATVTTARPCDARRLEMTTRRTCSRRCPAAPAAKGAGHARLQPAGARASSKKRSSATAGSRSRPTRNHLRHAGRRALRRGAVAARHRCPCCRARPGTHERGAA